MSAAENKKAQGAQGKEAQVKEDQSINDAAGWAKVRGDWAKEKLAVAEAKADRFFNTDDDLPLSQHLILMFIAAFFVIFVIWANFAALDEVTRGDGKVIPSTRALKAALSKSF